MRSRPSRSRVPRSRSAARPIADPVADTAATLAGSLRATAQGLGAFLNSLRQGGLAQAAGPYRQLQVTLLQQRAWALRHGRGELDPLWHELAITAGAIHAILAGFAEVMQHLKEIDRIEAVDGIGAPAPLPATVEGQAALEALLAPLSLAARRKGGDGDSDAAARLDELCRAGILEQHGWGRGRSLRFTPAALRALAGSLARLSAAAPPNGRDKEG